MFILTQKKQCSKCGEVKPLSEFAKDKKRKDGVKALCKKCWADYMRVYTAKHPEKNRARARQWREDNPERYRAGLKKWREENPQKAHDVWLRWARANPEKAGRWKRENKDKKYPVKPELRRIHDQNRKARILGNGGKITAAEWQSLKEHYNFTCLKCGRREPEIKLTIDHVVPLVMGGKNMIENVQPLCGSCNSSKNAKHIDYRGKKKY